MKYYVLVSSIAFGLISHISAMNKPRTNLEKLKKIILNKTTTSTDVQKYIQKTQPFTHQINTCLELIEKKIKKKQGNLLLHQKNGPLEETTIMTCTLISITMSIILCLSGRPVSACLLFMPIVIAIVYPSWSSYTQQKTINQYKQKLGYLEELEQYPEINTCCICKFTKAPFNNIPCDNQHPQDSICAKCLYQLDQCPLCRTDF